MSGRRRSRRARLAALVLLAALALLGGLLGWGLLATGGGGKDDDDAAVRAPSHAEAASGEPRPLTLDAEARRRNGIVILRLTPATAPRWLSAYGSVLDSAPLAALAASHASAAAQRSAAVARLAMARAAFQRARKLYGEQRNVSEAAMEAAEAEFHAAEAALAQAEAALRGLEDAAVQDWGETLARAVFAEEARARRLIAGEDRLVLATVPEGVALPRSGPPPRAWITTAPGRELRLLAPATRADPRLQGTALLYVAAEARDLLPGTSLLLRLPGEPLADAVLVPSDAVVWWRGQAWIYLRTGPDRFARRAVATDTPEAGGYVIANPAPGQSSVELAGTGAQALLSEEFRTQIQLGDEGEQP